MPIPGSHEVYFPLTANWTTWGDLGNTFRYINNRSLSKTPTREIQFAQRYAAEKANQLII